MSAGVPVQIVEDDFAWAYFLLHGGGGVITDWEASWITPAQARELLELLEPAIIDTEGAVLGYDLIPELRQRAARASQAVTSVDQDECDQRWSWISHGKNASGTALLKETGELILVEGTPRSRPSSGFMGSR